MLAMHSLGTKLEYWEQQSYFCVTQNVGRYNVGKVRISDALY